MRIPESQSLVVPFEVSPAPDLVLSSKLQELEVSNRIAAFFLYPVLYG